MIGYCELIKQEVLSEAECYYCDSKDLDKDFCCKNFKLDYLIKKNKEG